MKVKICGLLVPGDADAAAGAGADMLGVVFAPSRRRRTIAEAKAIFGAAPANVERVGVFVDASIADILEVVESCRLTRIQLSGRETPQFCRALGAKAIKTLRMPKDASRMDQYPDVLLHLDTAHGQFAGGTGVPWNYAAAASIAEARSVLLAGGLTPENVADAIFAARPWGVDVSSGVESDGVKDPAKISAFVRNARAAFVTVRQPA